MAGAVALAASCKGKERAPKGEAPAEPVAPAAFEEPAVGEADEQGIAPRGPGPTFVPRPDELVIVPGSGQLFAAPRPDALSFSRGRNTLAHAFPARVIAADADWVELELPAAEAGHACSQMPDGLSGLVLRVFARTDSLLYTASRPIEIAFADRTYVGLMPGVPMYPVRDRPKHYLAGGGVALVTVRLDDGDVRRSFVAPGPERAWEARPPIPAGEKVPGSHLPSDTAGVTDGTQPVVFAHDPADDFAGEVTAAWKHGAGLLVEVDRPCLAVRSIIGETDLSPRPRATDGAMGPERGPALGAGTALYWSDGTPAGRTSAEVRLGPLQPDDQGRPCGSLYFDWEPVHGAVRQPRLGTPMPLCIAAP